MRFDTLSDWLDWQQSLHPSEIDLGLDRVRAVAGRLGLLEPDAVVFTVGGTNGKGSCVAYLEACLAEAGYRVGAYTSPHLLRYNERIRIDRREIDDEPLIEAFERVDVARAGISLTYFEFGTLAALDLFRRSGCDAWVLEVGLGGRLDAVNVVDADVAIITNVGVDHTDWLGADRDSIGAEKAGIFRHGRPAVYGEADIPASVSRNAGAIGAKLIRAHADYRWRRQADRWDFESGGHRLAGLPLPRMGGDYQLANAAAALAALQAAGDRIRIDRGAIERGLERALVAGRFQVLAGPVEWIIDVAHNRDGALRLWQTLSARPSQGRTLALFAQLQRKELGEVIAAVRPVIDDWWLLELPDADARPVAQIAAELQAEGVAPVGMGAAPEVFDAIAAAAAPGDRIVVFGSFRTVEEALRYRGASRLDSIDED